MHKHQLIFVERQRYVSKMLSSICKYVRNPDYLGGNVNAVISESNLRIMVNCAVQYNIRYIRLTDTSFQIFMKIRDYLISYFCIIK